MNITIILVTLFVCVAAATIAWFNLKRDEQSIVLRKRVADLEQHINRNYDIVTLRGNVFHIDSIERYTRNPNDTINIVFVDGTSINSMYTDIDKLVSDLFDAEIREID